MEHPETTDKPEAQELPPEPSPERRRLLGFFSVLLAGLAAMAAGIPILGFLIAPVRNVRREEWIDLCAVDEVPVGQTKLVTYVNPVTQPWDGMTARVAAYVRNLGENQFTVLAVNCTHLGCPVSWFDGAGLFMCPCHGGVYYADGAHASGPPPRGLYHYEWKLEKGRIFVKGGHMPTLQNTLRPDEKG
ncbi:MAG: ubiquinol-cytochrome c reductase iron-sulfur subunit [Gemmataceae bacterium]